MPPDKPTFIGGLPSVDPSAEHRVGMTPPSPRQLEAPRSTLTWGESIGSISMLQPQNMINAPAGNNATITNIFNVNQSDGGDAKPKSARNEGLHEVATITRADHEIYSSQMLTKKRGYPLWVPGPGRQLPIEYRREGITIGDVGIITPLGAFDFLFNIFQSANDPINRGLTPQNFSPLSRQEFEGEIQEHTVYGPDTYLASSSVRKISTDWNSTDQRFESTAKEAAILMIPDGATTWDLLNTWKVRRIISSNAQDWYKYARITRGREVRNGEIRLVVGVDKVSSWGIATSACNTSQTAFYVFKHDPTHLYKWDCVGGSGRVGPQKRDIADLIKDNVSPENQSIFIRSVNFTFSGKIWNDFSSTDIRQFGSSSGPDSHGNPDEPGNLSSYDPSSGAPGASSITPGSGSTFSALCRQTGTTQASLLDIPCVDFDPVERLGVIHPSVAMHGFLHEMFPDADLVITEDMDWISVLHDDGGVFPEPEALCDRILGTHDVQNDSGIIQLLRKDTAKFHLSRTAENVAFSFSEAPCNAGVSSMTRLDFRKPLKMLSQISAIPEVVGYDDIFSWTHQDCRESVLFNRRGIAYRFQTTVGRNGGSVTTFWRALKSNRETRIAKLEWARNGGLERVIMGKHNLHMTDSARSDPHLLRERGFTGPDGLSYRWEQSPDGKGIVLRDFAEAIIAQFLPIRPMYYQIGVVYGELRFFRTQGNGTVMHPPMQDTVVLTAMLYRFSEARIQNLQKGVIAV